MNDKTKTNVASSVERSEVSEKSSDSVAFRKQTVVVENMERPTCEANFKQFRCYNVDTETGEMEDFNIEGEMEPGFRMLVDENGRQCLAILLPKNETLEVKSYSNGSSNGAYVHAYRQLWIPNQAIRGFDGVFNITAQVSRKAIDKKQGDTDLL